MANATDSSLTRRFTIDAIHHSCESTSISKPSYKIQRIILGMIAFICLGIGAFLYFLQPATDPLVVGMLIRVGALLAVICLAFPELMSLKGRMPVVIFALALICIVLIAVRPKLSRVLVSLLVVGVGVGSVMKWMTKIANNDPRKR